MANTLVKLEDRILVLKDRVDVLTKAFNPNQARDEKGRWSSGGSRVSPKTLASIKHEGRAVYHGTFGKWRLKSIMRDGLIANRAKGVDYYMANKDKKESFVKEAKGAVYVAETYMDASFFAQFMRPLWARMFNAKPVVLRIALPPDANRDITVDTHTAGSVRIPGNIPPEWITGYNYPGEFEYDDKGVMSGIIWRKDLNKAKSNTIYVVVPVADEDDDLDKAFDPNQVRDALGRWAESGASSVARAGTSVKTWASKSKAKVSAALPNNMGEKAKDVLGVAVSALVSNVAGMQGTIFYEDEVKSAVRHIRDGLQVTGEQARDHLKGVLTKLRAERKKEIDDDDISKSTGDPVLDMLDEMLDVLDKLDLEELEKPISVKKLTKLEDRVLLLQDRIDVVLTKYSADQPRDEEGRWAKWGRRAAYVAGATLAVGALLTGAAIEGYRRETFATAERYGVPKNKVSFNLGDDAPTVAGLKGKVLGRARPGLGTIELFPRNIGLLNVKELRATVAHEATHVMMSNYLYEQPDNLKWINKNINKLKIENRVGGSPYSHALWKWANQSGLSEGETTKRAKLAFEETIAEMSAAREEGKEFYWPPMAREFYDKMMVSRKAA